MCGNGPGKFVERVRIVPGSTYGPNFKDVVTFSEVRNTGDIDFLDTLKEVLTKRGHSFYGDHTGGDVGFDVIDTNQNGAPDYVTDVGSIIAYNNKS